MTAVRTWLGKVDAAVARAEAALIVLLLAVMVGAVFLDAMHRTFSAQEGRLASLLAGLAPANQRQLVHEYLAPALLAVITFLIVRAALQSRADRLQEKTSRRRPGLIAALVTLVLAAATQALVRFVPSGLVFSQQMALSFLLWVGLLGASLGTRERAHIAFELAGKLWPGPLQRPAEVMARIIAGGFSLFLAVLAFVFAREHYREWAQSGGAAGLFEAFRVPRFFIYGFLPVPFAVMGLRFFAYGVRPVGEPVAPTPNPVPQEGPR